MRVQVPENETKRDKFVRLANKRVVNATRAIRLVGNLSSPATYEFSDRDVAKMFDAIQDESEKARDKFRKGKGRQADFSL